MNAPNCPDCNVPMDEGRILDHNYARATFSQTQPSPVDPENVLWIADFPNSARVDRRNWRPVVSYCCPECGLLREYARAKPEG